MYCRTCKHIRQEDNGSVYCCKINWKANDSPVHIGLMNSCCIIGKYELDKRILEYIATEAKDKV